jgi:hypothetical protein
MTMSDGRKFDPHLDEVANLNSPLWFRALSWAPLVILALAIGVIAVSKISWFWLAVPVALIIPIIGQLDGRGYDLFIAKAQEFGVSREEADAYWWYLRERDDG